MTPSQFSVLYYKLQGLPYDIPRQKRDMHAKCNLHPIFKSDKKYIYFLVKLFYLQLTDTEILNIRSINLVMILANHCDKISIKLASHFIVYPSDKYNPMSVCLHFKMTQLSKLMYLYLYIKLYYSS